MNQKLIDKTETYFNSFPEGIAIRGTTTTNDEIKFAEKELNIKLNQDFINFVKLYDASYVGIEFFTIKQNKNNYSTIINVTKDARIGYSEDIRGGILNNGFVIADDGSGNPFVISEDGKVIILYHDCDEYKVLAPSFPEFLEGMILGSIELN